MTKMHAKRHQPRNYSSKSSSSELPERYEDGRELLRKLGYKPLIRVPPRYEDGFELVTCLGRKPIIGLSNMPSYLSRSGHHTTYKRASREIPLSTPQREQFFNYLNNHKEDVQIYRDSASERHRFFIYLEEEIANPLKPKKNNLKRKK